MPAPTRCAVAADIVVVARFPDGPRVLLIERKNVPQGWAIPGGFVKPDEDLPDATCRELREETGVVAGEMVEFGAYGRPGRDPRGPERQLGTAGDSPQTPSVAGAYAPAPYEGRTISIVFGALMDEPPCALAADDAAALRWFPVNQLPDNLAFDHAEVLNDAFPVMLGKTAAGES